MSGRGGAALGHPEGGPEDHSDCCSRCSHPRLTGSPHWGWICSCPFPALQMYLKAEQEARLLGPSPAPRLWVNLSGVALASRSGLFMEPVPLSLLFPIRWPQTQAACPFRACT